MTRYTHIKYNHRFGKNAYATASFWRSTNVIHIKQKLRFVDRIIVKDKRVKFLIVSAVFIVIVAPIVSNPAFAATPAVNGDPNLIISNRVDANCDPGRPAAGLAPPPLS